MRKKDVIYFCSRSIQRFLSFGRKIEKSVVFQSYGGRSYSDNPRAISEKMHELYPEYKIIWVLNDPEKHQDYLPTYVKSIKLGSYEYYKTIVKSFCIVKNDAMESNLYKRKNQYFIQTWHGDRGIKKILYDSLNSKGIKSNDYIDGKITDLFVIGSDYAERRVASAFRYHGKILKCGCPRNDKLINPIGVESVLDKLNIKKETKILLYAPTLRKNSQIVESNINILETLEHLQQNGEDWKCMVRAHPKSLGISAVCSDKIIDVSMYPDIADLLMVSDMLITDYSSCAGDFILRKKPVILAQFDLEQYTKEDRTFYVDINETGFIIAHNQNELNSIIDNWTDEMYEENANLIMQYFGIVESGNSAEQVCHTIVKVFQETFG